MIENYYIGEFSSIFLLTFSTEKMGTLATVVRRRSSCRDVQSSMLIGDYR